MAKKKAAKSGGADEAKLWAILSAVFLILFFIPLWVIKPRKDYAVYYGKQAFMLLITAIAVQIVGAIIPFIGWWIILPLGSLAVFILWIIGIVNAASDKKKPLPVIGKLAIDWFKSL
ncbi:hypothetical protein KY348_06930 [Candidatus Woesearchaeota archaeon]|nr:hypothetical protein [Candidatus Woesearchaeota archaeon]